MPVCLPACLSVCMYACLLASLVLPWDSFTSSYLQCQLLAISFCNKMSHVVISVQCFWDVTQFKQPPREGMLRTTLCALASTFLCTVLFQSTNDTLVPVPPPFPPRQHYEHARVMFVACLESRDSDSDTWESLRLAETPKLSAVLWGEGLGSTAPPSASAPSQ